MKYQAASAAAAAAGGDGGGDGGGGQITERGGGQITERGGGPSNEEATQMARKQMMGRNMKKATKTQAAKGKATGAKLKNKPKLSRSMKRRTERHEKVKVEEMLKYIHAGGGGFRIICLKCIFTIYCDCLGNFCLES